MLEVWGLQYTVENLFSRPFQWYTTSPQVPKISIGKTKKTIIVV